MSQFSSYCRGLWVNIPLIGSFYLSCKDIVNYWLGIFSSYTYIIQVLTTFIGQSTGVWKRQKGRECNDHTWVPKKLRNWTTCSPTSLLSRDEPLFPRLPPQSSLIRGSQPARVLSVTHEVKGGQVFPHLILLLQNLHWLCKKQKFAHSVMLKPFQARPTMSESSSGGWPIVDQVLSLPYFVSSASEHVGPWLLTHYDWSVVHLAVQYLLMSPRDQ